MDEWLELLKTLFDEEELRTLSFVLGIEYDDLPAQGRENKARELIRRLGREKRTAHLISTVQKARPHVEIPEILVQKAEIDLPEELRTYLEVMARRNRRLSLGALDPTGKESGHIAIDQVFVNLSVGTNIYYSGEEIRIYDAIVGCTYYHPRLILLGNPGSGKSTILRFLAYCLANHCLQPNSNGASLLSWLEIEAIAANQSGEYITTQLKGDTRKIYLTDLFSDAIETKSRSWTDTFPVPVLVTLRDFARTNFDPQSPSALWQFVEEQLKKEELTQLINPLRTIALRGGVIFLLDGVDEVPNRQRPDIWHIIDALGDGPYGSNRWIATCRELSFVEREAPFGVPVHTLKPLHPQQIKQFVASWYNVLVQAGELPREEAKQKTKSLQAAAQRQRLRPLAENPMLLTIMAIVQTYYGTLPHERAKLYQACVETLLLRWQRHKEQSEQELPDMLAQLETNQTNLERLLWEVAWKAHSESNDREVPADIPEIDVLQIAKKHLGSYGKAEQFLEYTERRAHLLIGRGGEDERVYTFPHRTFQEYLAACHLASGRRFPHKAAKLAAENDNWREVLSLAAGTLAYNQNNREKALDGVAEVLPGAVPDLEDESGWFRVWLAGEMAVVVGREAIGQDEVGKEILPRLQEQLVTLITNARLSPRERVEAGDALGFLGDPRPGVCALEPDMIPITAGTFLMGGDKHEAYVDAFSIACSPVTNAQFRFFVKDGGYTEKWVHCWSRKGWQFRQEENWTKPAYWHDAVWSLENKPVVGVSWFEAEAYFNWLSEKAGRKYRLPTDEEWERAARHTDGRRYPWGNIWQEDVANTEAVGIGKTTTVGIFPYGNAVCGAQDMGGNVWEWTSGIVVRGGSWNYLRWSLRVAARVRHLPHFRSNYIGLRLAASLLV